MLTHILTTTRNRVDIPWYTISQEVYDRRQTVYIDTGKIVSREEAEDTLVRTITTVFKTEEDFVEYVADSVIRSMIQDRNQYNKTNEIVSYTEVG